MIRVLVVKDSKITEMEIESSLESYYKITGRPIDIASRRVGGKYYDFIINDEGRLDDLPPYITFSETNEDLRGNVIIANANEKGETIGLTDEDVANITDNMKYRTLIWGDEMITQFVFNGGI